MESGFSTFVGRHLIALILAQQFQVQLLQAIVLLLHTKAQVRCLLQSTRYAKRYNNLFQFSQIAN